MTQPDMWNNMVGLVSGFAEVKCVPKIQVHTLKTFVWQPNEERAWQRGCKGIKKARYSLQNKVLVQVRKSA